MGASASSFAVSSGLTMKPAPCSLKPGELTAALEHLLGDPELRLRLAANARRVIDDWTWVISPDFVRLRFFSPAVNGRRASCYDSPLV